MTFQELARARYSVRNFLDAPIEEEKMSLILETPNAYMWQYADAFLDMPLGSSDFLYLDQDIPFLSLVLKGVMPMYSDYVNFEANKTENFLGGKIEKL